MEKRQRQRETERLQQRQHEVRKIDQQSVNAANAAAWDTWFEAKFMAAMMDPDMIDVFGQVQADTCKKLRREYAPKIEALQARIKELEQHQSLEAKFFEMEHRLDSRRLARDEAKRGSEMIPQSELLAKIEKLQRQVDELKSMADLDARFRELTVNKPAVSKRASLSLLMRSSADQRRSREVTCWLKSRPCSADIGSRIYEYTP